MLRLSAAAGLLLSVVLVASPLTTCVLLTLPLFFAWAGRGLPLDERRALIGVLIAALVVRVAIIVGLFVAGLSHLNDLSIGALSGDESYNLARALRARDIVLGFGTSKYDYFVVSDEYGRTVYVWLLGWLQVIFGPTPYSMRLVNAMLFLIGATLLYRMARTAFGPVPSLLAIAALLFTPSLLFSSVSLLKESLFFLATTIVITRSVHLVRRRGLHTTLLAIAMIGVALWILDDLRRSAAVLAAVGIGLGFAGWIIAAKRWRVAAAATVIAAVILLTLSVPALRNRALNAVLFAAKTHAGHVFTVGHAYKLMDEGFYQSPGIGPSWDIRLTGPQALRFLVRATISFVVTPLPWQMASRSELAFFPEHVWWYLLVAMVPFGLVAGWKRDRLVTAILIGYVIPTAAVLALTNGNVGTLLRLRGLVSPYLIWLSALGMLTVAERLASRASTLGRDLTPRLAMNGPSV